MTEPDQAEYERAQALLREAKPSWLQRMAPEAPIVPAQIPERQAKFDMGMTPIALIGDANNGGGGAADGANMTVGAAEQIAEGVFKLTLININATEA